MMLNWWEDLKPAGPLKTLNFLTQVTPLTFDPTESFDVVTRNVITNLYEGLLVQDPVTLELGPGIADSWEVVEPGRAFRFHLRTNTRFSDGDPILVEDVVYSIQRIPQFEGVGIWVSEDAPRVIRIELDQPMHCFLDYLATPSFSIVSKRHVEMHGFHRENLVTSGPFKLKENADHHPSLVFLEKNPYYWDAANVQLDAAVYIPIMDADERLRLFRTRYSPSGQRLYYFLNHAPVLRYQELKHDPELQPEPVLATIVLTPNQRKKPLDDARVRRALSLAICRQNVIESCLPHLDAADALVPQNMRNFPEARGLVYENEGEARRCLQEAGYENGIGFPEMTLTILGHEYMELMAQSFIQDWKRVLGITVRYERLPWGEYLQRLDTGDYDLLYETWHTDIADAGTFLLPLSTDHPFNTSGSSDPRFDELMERSLEEMQEERRTELYLEAERIALEEMATIPLFFEAHFCMVDSGVLGAQLSRTAVLPLKHIELLEGR
ncbi:peptide ABC transporter substrate-binding protein [Tumebacillus sp. ITR2]|uniref:Peptide ABC transporter substrate-binding protein n=1 Tax=Tumebacillus amylolyticus TaxID=2801339 RepID=A0ABS1JDX2_9BACL|nr:peptide ABC transporter substrate-binding protein [Tumebacillus amylolyticus]MBL0388415.1 peptide ABC transporter substrate-binding protein [Tumebacillus amylolyticus]